MLEKVGEINFKIDDGDGKFDRSFSEYINNTQTK